MKINLKTIITQLPKSPNFAIFGAQVVAYGTYTALKSLYGLVPECFLVSYAQGNPSKIEDTDVLTIESSGLDTAKTLVIIAVTELLQDEVCLALEKYGFRHFLRIGSHEEHLLMSAYFNSIGRFPLLKSVKPGIDSQKIGIRIYEVKNIGDKLIRNPVKLLAWETSIQAGAALTDERIAALTDDTGENISFKNRQYSELSATYWVWKNTSHKWKGICHYRRHLLISPEQLSLLEKNEIDALLPLPYICYPNTLAQFNRFVGKKVEDVLLKSLRTLNPEDYDTYQDLLKGQYQYTYNLLCARSDIFDKYCEWLFSVLGFMEGFSREVPEIGSTRALSYAAEVLTSLYFLSREKKLNIRHIEKTIIV